MTGRGRARGRGRGRGRGKNKVQHSLNLDRPSVGAASLTLCDHPTAAATTSTTVMATEAGAAGSWHQDLQLTRQQQLLTQRRLKTIPLAKRRELEAKQDTKMMRRMLLPDAPPRKRKAGKSPVRKSVDLVPGTPHVPPPRVPPRWEVTRSPELIEVPVEVVPSQLRYPADLSDDACTPHSDTSRMTTVSPGSGASLDRVIEMSADPRTSSSSEQRFPSPQPGTSTAQSHNSPPPAKRQRTSAVYNSDRWSSSSEHPLSSPPPAPNKDQSQSKPEYAYEDSQPEYLMNDEDWAAEVAEVLIYSDGDDDAKDDEPSQSLLHGNMMASGSHYLAKLIDATYSNTSGITAASPTAGASLDRLIDVSEDPRQSRSKRRLPSPQPGTSTAQSLHSPPPTKLQRTYAPHHPEPRLSWSEHRLSTPQPAPTIVQSHSDHEYNIFEDLQPEFLEECAFEIPGVMIESDADDDAKDDDPSQPLLHGGIMASDYPAELPDDLDDEVVRRIQEVDAAEDAIMSSLLPPESLHFGWTEDKTAFQGRRETFTGQAGPTFALPSSTKPVDVFLKIWDVEILDLIVRETNLYAEKLIQSSSLKQNSRLKKWQPITREELLVFFSVLMVQAIYPLPVEQSYWYNSFRFAEMPNFKTMMQYNRFVMIKRVLHFVSTPTVPTQTKEQKRLHKIKPILDHLSIKFAELYMPDQNIALDESLLKWMGRLSFAQKIATKAAEIGIKSFELCESRTGYLWSFKIYTGKGSDEQDHPEDEPTGATAHIVFELARPLFHKGHTLVMDNYYNSPLLSRCLKRYGTDSMGTLRINREFVAPSLKRLKKTSMRVGEVCVSQCEDLTTLLWRDSNLVSMISTYHPAEVGAVEKYGVTKYKPQVVLDYNKVMGGVDKKDQLLAAAPLERIRNQVWYKKLFRRLLNVSILNSFIIYRCKEGTHNLRQRDFRHLLVENLMQIGNINTMPRTITTKVVIPLKFGKKEVQRPILVGNHFLEKCPRSRCLWCASKGRESRTKKRCDTCLVALCGEFCFKDFHTAE